MTFSATGRILEAIRGCPAVIPGALTVVVVLVLGAFGGGYAPTAWYPAGLFLLGLLAVCLLGLELPSPPRRVQLAIALIGAYAAWSYLSISWAERPALAWEGANRSALYALVLALLALWPLEAWAGRALIALFGLGVGGIALVQLLEAASAAQPLQYFTDARLAAPLGYVNANVAFWTMGMVACLFAASSRELAAAVRALALGSAGVCGGIALMGQSRG